MQDIRLRVIEQQTVAVATTSPATPPIVSGPTATTTTTNLLDLNSVQKAATKIATASGAPTPEGIAAATTTTATTTVGAAAPSAVPDKRRPMPVLLPQLSGLSEMNAIELQKQQQQQKQLHQHQPHHQSHQHQHHHQHHYQQQQHHHHQQQFLFHHQQQQHGQPPHGQLSLQQQQQNQFQQLQQQVPRSPSSEEDNSPTEMNNCRRLVDKPPLVKRLTMGMGMSLLRSTEDSRPLVHTTSSSLNSGSSQTISDGYVNEAICEPEKLIANKFGDSCRQSLTALSSLEHASQRLQEHNEFNCKKKFLRETCSANSSPKMFAPSAPLRLDSLSLAEQNELKGAAWFQAGIPREISLEVLSRQSPGAFLVRQSSTKPGCFALSLRVPPPAPKVAHYLILRTPRGYKIKGFTKEFTSLRALITHHSVMPELLPVPLALPRPTNISSSSASSSGAGSRHESRASGLDGGGSGSGDDFEMYGSLNDFRKIMSDLNA